ncbi:hypothetical protein [Amycolatopsis anabasis]|uniref:hypothetical protein n=1 Tax=Amycolatopsis anabasis TaxID=1840409 RepID=UPI00131C06EA|nr:hypothetical protein [Amycolatopsis anabasis]
MTSTVDLPDQRGGEPIVDESADTTVAVPQESDESTDLASGAVAASDDLTQRRAEWEDEYDRILRFDPNEVVIDENVRQENADADDDTVRDMRSRGVDTAVKGYRAEDGTVMITMGQRRVLNAREAGCELPVWMQAPPPADKRKAAIERIVAQVNENDLRKGLTRGDEYNAVRQLAAFNLKPAGIARKLNRGAGGAQHIENVLKVGDSELAAAAADRYGLDLEQMAVVAEFEGSGDLDTAKELIKTALQNPNNFKVLAESKRQDRAERERVRELTERLTQELTEAGVTILDPSVNDWTGDARSLDRLRPSPDSEPYTELTVEAHASCPGHAAWIDEDYDDDENPIVVAKYGCTDFRAHGHALAHAPEGQAEFSTTVTPATTDDVSTEDDDGEHGDTEAAAAAAAEERARQAARILRRWVIENNKLWDAAKRERRNWLVNFVNRKKVPRGAQVFLAVQKAKGSHELRRAMERNHKLAHELLKLPEPGYGQPSQLPDEITTASAASASKAVIYDVFLTLCAMETDLTRDAWRKPWEFEKEYMSAIIDWGYDASDVERKVLNPEREEDVVAAQLGTHESAGDIEGDGAGEVEADEDEHGDGEDAEEDEDSPGDDEFGDDEVDDPESVDGFSDPDGESESTEADEAWEMSSATV